MLRTVRHLHEQTGMDNLCLAGGVALNCVGNGRILREGPFKRLWIQPAAGDAGGALGTALFIWHQLLGRERKNRAADTQRGSCWDHNTLMSRFAISSTVRKRSIGCFDEEDELCRHVAGLIASEKVVGWLQGRVEFGPRALGNRSILGDARSRNMQSVMNLKIKFRESFRPFAPVVLQERASEYFEMDDGAESPYMLLVAPVRNGQARASAAAVARRGWIS